MHTLRKAEKDDDDPSAYKPAPSADAKTKPSKHTKKFKQMFQRTTNRRRRQPKNTKEKKVNLLSSDKHSDLYTDENPKELFMALKFATVEDAKASVAKIEKSGKKHAHKIQV